MSLLQFDPEQFKLLLAAYDYAAPQEQANDEYGECPNYYALVDAMRLDVKMERVRDAEGHINLDLTDAEARILSMAFEVGYDAAASWEVKANNAADDQLERAYYQILRAFRRTD